MREVSADLDQDILVELRKLGQGGDPQLFSNLIELFLSDSKDNLAALKLARESGDHQRIKWLAHRIKGATGSFGARTMARICKELEELTPDYTAETVKRLIDALHEEFVRIRKALEAEACS